MLYDSRGDSGGPLIGLDRSAIYQAGIVSWGEN